MRTLNNTIINCVPVFQLTSQSCPLSGHDRGCLMLEVTDVPEIRDLQYKIPQVELYHPDESRYGLEEDQHITILYGLDPSISTQLLITDQLPKIRDYKLIQTRGISLFENEDCDVLKVDVYNPLLNWAFQYLSNTFPNDNSHPEYHGHITVAYLKSGYGQQYIDKNFRKAITPTNYWYSYDGRNDRFVL